MNKPYYYRIRSLVTGQRYIGSQYGSGADPSNLFCNYFTSSKKVQLLIENNGVESFVIEKIVQIPNARTLEAKVLKRLYNLLGKEEFMLRFINRNVSPGILMDEASTKKRANNPTRRKRLSESHKEKYKDGYTNPFKGCTHTDDTKRYLSEIAKQRFMDLNNHPRGFKGHSHSELTRQKISNNNPRSFLGVTGSDHPSYGLKWWNNGLEDVRSYECPGEGWVSGRVFKPRNKRSEKGIKEK